MSTTRRWAALAALVLPVLLISIDMSVLGIAVPAISADLSPTSTQLLWIIDLYSFLLAGLLVLMGTLGDRFGRRRLLLIGAPAFGAASLMAAFSTSAEMLIVARALLGIGGATLMPSTLGLLRTIFPDRAQRRTAIAVWAAAFSGGAAFGPAIGGFLLEHFWWGSVFLLNVPVIVIFIVACIALVPESRDPNPGPFDPVSALMSIAALIPIVYALKTAAKNPDWPAALAFAFGAVMMWAFIRRQQRLTHPMLDLGLFSSPGFGPAVLINVISVFTLMGALFFIPQYLMLVQGMGSGQAGLWMLPIAGGTVIGSLISPLLARLLSVRTVIMIGLVLLVAGFLIGTRIDDAGLLAFFLASMAMGFGVGMAETLTNDVILTTAPPSRAGGAAAISETGYEFGGAMGTAVLGTIGLAVYARVLDSVPGVGTEEMSRARETLGGADQVASDLPAEAGTALLEQARTAFVSGMDIVMLVSAGVAALTLVVAWRGLQVSAVDGAERQRQETPGAS